MKTKTKRGGYSGGPISKDNDLPTVIMLVCFTTLFVALVCYYILTQ